jgi:hypothetical protein
LQIQFTFVILPANLSASIESGCGLEAFNGQSAFEAAIRPWFIHFEVGQARGLDARPSSHAADGIAHSREMRFSPTGSPHLTDMAFIID